MKFYFEYKPVLLKEYVKKHFAKRDLLPYPDYELASFISMLERLRGQTDIKVGEPIDSFTKWIESLEKKYKRLIPFVYTQLVNDAQRKVAIVEMSKIVSSEKVVFAHLLHECYSTNTFMPFWDILSRAYIVRGEQYNQTWDAQTKQAWHEYVRITNDHVSFVGDKVLERARNIEAVLDLYFVREEHAFYEAIVLYVFDRGTVELFQREKQRFVQMLQAADNVTAQRLATGFIAANALEALEDVSYAILDKLRTYKERPMYWANTEPHIKEAFHRWYLRKNIHEFFNDVSNKDHKRFLYWERFIPNMHDAFVLYDRKTIVFYFSDVVIVEILGTGAAYVYDRHTFNASFAHDVEQYREQLLQHDAWIKHLKREHIMNKALVYKDGWLTHTGNWQAKFDTYLKQQLGWDIHV